MTSETKGSANITPGVSKQYVRENSYDEYMTGTVSFSGSEVEYGIYWRFPSKTVLQQALSADMSRWIVLYDGDEKVIAATDVWETLPKQTVEPIRAAYEARRRKELEEWGRTE